MDLTINDLTKHDPVLEIHPNLPSIPFNLCVYGKSSCGKTNVIINMLKWYNTVFKNRVIIFTKSMNGLLYSLQNSIGAVIHNTLTDENGNDIIESVINFQKQSKENGEPLKNVLILFDDWITDTSFNNKRGVYDKLYSMARHFNISVITIVTTIHFTPSFN